MTSSLLALSESFAKESQQGGCSFTAISAETASIVVVRVPSRSKAFVLSICVDRSDNMAMAMRAAFDTANALATILDGA